MKKVVLFALCATMFVACNKKELERSNQQKDSLAQVVANKDAELDELMGTFNDIQEGFRQINEAEGRVDLAKGAEGNNKAKISENIKFIAEKMEQNRKEIANLKARLRNSSYNTTKLKETIEQLTKQLEEKEEQIKQLQAELEQKNIRIAELDQTVANLNSNVADLQATKAANEKTMADQDASLNTVYYVLANKKTLKQNNILKSGDVLKNGDFNNSFFTKGDLRKITTIQTNSKKATIMTSHPSDSYTLEKNGNKEYVLTITNQAKFWSISKYLVIVTK